MSGHLTSQKIVRNVGLPLVNQFLAQGYALVRILSALKIKSSTYYNWRHWQPSRQEKRRESLKPYILDVWKTFKFYGYRRIAAYSQLNSDCPKISEYMTLKLMRELGIRSRMQKRYRKPKTVVTVDQKLVCFRSTTGLLCITICQMLSTPRQHGDLSGVYCIGLSSPQMATPAMLWHPLMGTLR